MTNYSDRTFKCQVGLEVIIKNDRNILEHDPIDPCVEEAYLVAAMLEKCHQAGIPNHTRLTAFRCAECQFSDFFPSGDNATDYAICNRCGHSVENTISGQRAAAANAHFTHKIGRKYTVSQPLSQHLVKRDGDLAVQDHYYLVEPVWILTNDFITRPAIRITTPRRQLVSEVITRNPELRELINDLGNAPVSFGVNAGCTTSIHVSFDRQLYECADHFKKMKNLIILTAILERDFLIPISAPHERGRDCVSMVTDTKFMIAPDMPDQPGNVPGSWAQRRLNIASGGAAVPPWEEQIFLGFPPSVLPNFWKHYQRGVHSPWAHDLNVFVNMVWGAKDPAELQFGMQSSEGSIPAVRFHWSGAELQGSNFAPQMSLEFRYQSATLDCGHINLWMELIGQMMKVVESEPAQRAQSMANLYSVLPTGGWPEDTDPEEMPLDEILRTFGMAPRAAEWLRRFNEATEGVPRPLEPSSERTWWLKRGGGDD